MCRIRTVEPETVARMEPTGLAFGEPEDRLREIRDSACGA
jgi:hypothetical protein